MKNNQIVAVIDVGTLKSKFEIRKYSNGDYEKLYTDKKLTVLGRKLSESNTIDNESIKLTIEAISEFVERMNDFGVTKYRAVTTEAIRKAENGNFVIDEIYNKTGVKLETISQEEESNLFFSNVCEDFNDNEIAVLDIGGGSVQLTVGGKGVMHSYFPLKTGTYFMQEMFSKGSKDHIVDQEEFEKTKKYICDHVDERVEINNNKFIDYIVFGSTNMIDFIKKFEINKIETGKSKHPFKIHINELYKILDILIPLTYEKRMELYPEEPYFMWAADRAIINILEIAKKLHVEYVVPSNENISGAIMTKLRKDEYE